MQEKSCSRFPLEVTFVSWHKFCKNGQLCLLRCALAEQSQVKEKFCTWSTFHFFVLTELPLQILFLSLELNTSDTLVKVKIFTVNVVRQTVNCKWRLQFPTQFSSTGFKMKRVPTKLHDLINLHLISIDCSRKLCRIFFKITGSPSHWIFVWKFI